MCLKKKKGVLDSKRDELFYFRQKFSLVTTADVFVAVVYLHLLLSWSAFLVTITNFVQDYPKHSENTVGRVWIDRTTRFNITNQNCFMFEFE